MSTIVNWEGRRPYMSNKPWSSRFLRTVEYWNTLELGKYEGVSITSLVLRFTLYQQLSPSLPRLCVCLSVSLSFSLFLSLPLSPPSPISFSLSLSFFLSHCLPHHPSFFRSSSNGLFSMRVQNKISKHKRTLRSSHALSAAVS